MKAAVPGKGGRRGAGRPGLGAEHRTRPARPFVRLSGAARFCALLRTRRGRAGARWARRGRGEAPAEERAPDRLQRGLGAAQPFVSEFLRGRFSPQGAVAGVKSLHYSGPAGEFEAGTRRARSRFPEYTVSRGGNSGPI